MSTVSRRPGDDDSEKVRWWVSPSMSTASVIAWPASNGIAPVSGRKVKVLTVGVSGRIPTQTSRCIPPSGRLPAAREDGERSFMAGGCSLGRSEVRTGVPAIGLHLAGIPFGEVVEHEPKRREGPRQHGRTAGGERVGK